MNIGDALMMGLLGWLIIGSSVCVIVLVCAVVTAGFKAVMQSEEDSDDDLGL